MTEVSLVKLDGLNMEQLRLEKELAEAIAAKEKAEREQQETAERAEREKKEAVEAEKKRAQDEAERVERERLFKEKKAREEEERRVANEEHRLKIRTRVIESLINGGIGNDTAEMVVDLISKNKVEYVTIQY